MSARAAAILLAIVGASAGPSSSVADGGDWAFTPTSARQIELPAAVVDSVEFGELEYAGPPYRGLRADLDGDGAPEYIVESASTLCGNGGCVYALFDGRTLRPLGLLFGGWLVVRGAPAAGFPPITAYSHLSAETATYSTFAYDGARYVLRTSREVRGEELDVLARELRRAPLR